MHALATENCQTSAYSVLNVYIGMSKLDLQAEGIKAQKGAQPVIHLDPFDYIGHS